MFWNEGMDVIYNLEFMMVEFYVVYKDYYWMMEMIEQLLEYVIFIVNGDIKV